MSFKPPQETIQRPCFLGDAIWSLAWRLCDNDHYSQFDGWHIQNRQEIVCSNKLQHYMARNLGLEHDIRNWRTGGTAFEAYLGNICKEKGYIVAVEIAIELIIEYIDFDKLGELIDEGIRKRRRTRKRNYAKILYHKPKPE